jgi:hypothetical protein
MKILVLAGSKQSGKSSAASFLAGYILTQLGRQGRPFCPTNFTIDNEGQLVVNTTFINADGTESMGDGILDLGRAYYDPDFIEWAGNVMWPFIKIYNFADPLKSALNLIFSIPFEKLYGTNADKEEPTDVSWKDMAKFLPPRSVSELKRTTRYERNLTIRELLQYFGTNICRRLDDYCWVKSCMNQVVQEQPQLAVIADGRFITEFRTAHKYDAKIIYFDRTIEDNADHESETQMHSYNKYDAKISNQHMTIKEKNQAILDILYEWGWLASDQFIAL